MRVTLVRPMPNFSMDVYADGVVAGLKAVRPSWTISELKPTPVDRQSRAISTRVLKAYERFWSFPKQAQQQLADADVIHIIDHSEAHIVRWLSPSHRAVVVTCHDLINYFYRDNLSGSVRLPFLSDQLWLNSVKSMRQADHVIAVSSQTAKDVHNILHIAEEKITAVPNAVDKAFRPLSQEKAAAVRHRCNATPQTICLLNVGSDHPRKNVDTILQVLEILRDKDFSVQLWKAGANFTSAQTDFINQKSLVEHVRYLGNPTQEALIEIYNAASVLIAPSFHEGFGLTLLEAIACATPVITSNVSAMPEVVGSAGILVSPQDAHAMASAVIRLQTDDAYRQDLISQGLQRAASFSWENSSEQLAQVYESLL